MTSRLIHVLSTCASVALVSCGTAFASTYHIDPAYSSAEILHAYRNVDARFSAIDGRVVYDPAQIERSTVDFSLPLRHLVVREPGRDIPVTGDRLFSAEEHPDIVFESTKVKLHGNVLMVSGRLSMLGKSRDVVLPVRVLGRAIHPVSGAPLLGFGAEITIRLADYGVGAWSNAAVLLGEEIKLDLRAVGKKQSDEVVKTSGSDSRS